MKKIIKKIFLQGVLTFLLLAVQVSAIGGEIVQINAATRHLTPKGKEVDAIDGDWIMKNDKIIVVIGNAGFGRHANQMTRNVQGAVIDFTTIAANDDNLVAYYPQNLGINIMSADEISVIKNKQKQIQLLVKRMPTEEHPFLTETVYTMNDGENFLRIKTTHSNPANKDVSFYAVDRLRLDKGIEEASSVGNHQLAFMNNKWFNAAYGIYSEKGLRVPAKPVVAGGRMGGIIVELEPGIKNSNAKTTLLPGQKIEFVRYLLYGKDVAEIQRHSLRWNAKNQFITSLRINAGAKPLSNVFVEIKNNKDEAISYATSNAAGIVQVPLTAGSYLIKGTKIGHDTVVKNLTITNKPQFVSMKMEPVTTLHFAINETGSPRRLPVKIEFKGINGTPDPYLGSHNRAEGADNLYYAINKKPFTVAISPGQYFVTISHGPEYEAVYRIVELKRGDVKRISAELKRSYQSPAWIISDFHNHTTRSGDNSSEVRSRIINMAAAGIEFAPATEHNNISTFTEDIKEAGLEEFIASCGALELSGQPLPLNHQNAFPLTIHHYTQSNGSPPPNADPYMQMKGLYEYDKDKIKLVQQNHPDIPWLYFDKNEDGKLDGGFGTEVFTDAIEIQQDFVRILDVTSDSGKNKKGRVFYWLQMLNQGSRMYGTTTSDNHVVGEGSGNRFVYVYSPKDKPADIDDRGIALHAKRGNIIMSNGPFIKTDLSGHLPGADIRYPVDGLKMNIEVYAERSTDINRIQILINGRQDKSLNFTRATHPHLFSTNSLQFKHSFPLHLKEDAHVIVVAAGVKELPNVNFTKKPNQRRPTAIANPFFIDVDGNGFVPNKDLLGVPLPVKRKNEPPDVEDEEVDGN